MQALGQAQGLQFADPRFEARDVEAQIVGEEAGIGVRHVMYHLQIVLRPRTAFAVFIELREFDDYVIKLSVAEIVIFPERVSRVFAREIDSHTIDGIVAIAQFSEEVFFGSITSLACIELRDLILGHDLD